MCKNERKKERESEAFSGRRSFPFSASEASILTNVVWQRELLIVWLGSEERTVDD